MHTHTTQTKQVGVFPCRGWGAPCQRAALTIKGLPRRCQTGRSGKASLEARQPSGLPRPWLAVRSAFALRASVDSLRRYGRESWAHLEFTHINIKPIILYKEIEDLRQMGAVHVPSCPRVRGPRARGQVGVVESWAVSVKPAAFLVTNRID